MTRFWTYLITAIVSAIPVLWLWLGAWMGVPIVATEYVSFLGSVTLVIAGYVSLTQRRAAAVFSFVGVAGTLSFFLVEPLRQVMSGAIPARAPSLQFLCLLGVVYTACTACIFIAVRDLSAASAAKVSVSRRRWVWGVSLLVICSLAGVEYWHEQSTRQTPSRYYMPAGYVGWVKINYGVRGADAPILSDGYLNFPISASGVLATSSEQQYGWATDKYFYRNADGSVQELASSGWGQGGMIWNESSGTMEEPGKPDQRSEQFFVGSEAQLHGLGDGEIRFGNIVPDR